MEQEEFEIIVPETDLNGQLTQRVTQLLNREELIEKMVDLQVNFFDEDMPMFDIWYKFFRQVCPVSLVYEFPYLDNFVTLESAASEYNTLPYEGGYLDQPLFIMDAFNAVRIARTQYERAQNEKFKREQQRQKNAR